MQTQQQAACCGGETVTDWEGGQEMKQCQVCHDSVAWDLVDDPFFGFTKPCETALRLPAQ